MISNDLHITWLTQGGFLFQAQNDRLLLDAYLSDVAEKQYGWDRLVSPPLDIEELKPTSILCTHDHIDHLDPIAIPRLMKLNPQCPLIGPGSVIETALNLGVKKESLTQIEPETQFMSGAFKVIVTPAKHSDPMAVGYIISFDNRVVYVSGDSQSYPELPVAVSTLHPEQLDLILICINGRMGNMSYLEALELVCQLRPKIAIPMHFGLFAENTVDPAPFVKECINAGINSLTLQPGEPFNLDEALKG